MFFHLTREGREINFVHDRVLCAMDSYAQWKRNPSCKREKRERGKEEEERGKERRTEEEKGRKKEIRERESERWRDERGSSGEKVGERGRKFSLPHAHMNMCVRR